MNRRRVMICLTGLFLWIAFIFCRSLQPADASTAESRWMLELLQQILPVELSMRLVRKLAHFTEFAILGVLAGLLFGSRCQRFRTGFLFAVMTGVMTALCDETIQLLVAGRTGQVQDVWLDTAGAFTGAVLALLGTGLMRRRK